MDEVPVVYRAQIKQRIGETEPKLCKYNAQYSSLGVGCSPEDKLVSFLQPEVGISHGLVGKWLHLNNVLLHIIFYYNTS